ncbi:MAG: SigB/SigF/SigG family RNA polymerase sigma factor [Bacilli bacterium]|nr:SigB/SigF/SigG family RNA polymerase sigma factor [Bacilli bacterium]
MARHKVEITGIKTSELKTLTSDEQLDLFKKFKNGDSSAREKIIEGNLKLILSILKKFVNRCDNMDDLFQIGCIGLCKAVDNFDLSYNVKFSTYAVPMIIGEVRRYLRDDSMIRISRSVKDIAYKSLKAKEQFMIEHGREATIGEISKMIDIDEMDIVCALEATRGTISMFEPIYNDGGETIYLFDQIENPNESSTNWNNKIILSDALNKLKLKEKFIIMQRYLIGKTQMEISDELGISQAQVSRIEKNAINNVKKLIK